MTRIVADAIETTDIVNKLREVGTSLPAELPPEERTYKFNPGWSDERVAAEVSPRLTKAHVLHIRQKYFGTLYQKGVKPEAGDTDELSELIKRLDELETIVLQQGDQIAKLQSEKLRDVMPKSNGLVPTKAMTSLPLLSR